MLYLKSDYEKEKRGKRITIFCFMIIMNGITMTSMLANIYKILLLVIKFLNL